MIELNDKAQAELSEMIKLEKRGLEILKIVVAEWESDPTSVQCFDLGVVKEASDLVKRLKKLKPKWDYL